MVQLLKSGGPDSPELQPARLKQVAVQCTRGTTRVPSPSQVTPQVFLQVKSSQTHLSQVLAELVT